MTWEEKFAAIKALSFDASLRMRKPGDWYVSAPGVEVSIRQAGLLSDYGNGTTPQEAVEDHWLRWTDLPNGERHHLVKNAMGKDRAAYRWNGYMWATVYEDVRASELAG